MTDINLLIWAMGGGFAGTWAILFYSLKQISKVDEKLSNQIIKLDEKLSNQIIKLDEKLSNQISKLDEKLTDVDRRLCRLEGAFASKDCCMIKDHRSHEKAE